MLLERMQSWTERWKQEGIVQGLAQGMEKGMEKGIMQGLARGYLEGERATYVRLARRRFRADVANLLSPLLERIQDREQLASIGEWLLDCELGEDLLRRVQALGV